MSKIIDEIGNKDLLKKLEEFGLSKKEAAIYLALLPRKDTGSSKLIQATGLHGQFVYDGLAKLEELGLAKHVIQGGRKKFSAGSPQRLLSLIEEKKFVVQSVAKELQSRFAGAHEQDLEVYQGESSFMAHQIDLLRRSPQGGTVDAIANESEWFQETFVREGLWDEFLQLQTEKQVKIRYLGSEAQRERLQQREKVEPLWTYRILPGQSTGKMSVDIWTDSVTFIVYSKPMLCFTLTSKEVADGYHEFFNAIWALSHK